MAEKKLKQIRDETMERFPVAAIRLRHRVGALEIGEIAVAIEVLSAHRDEAYDASREMIERVKTEVPIWKKEFYTDGTSAWTLCEHVRQPGRGKRRCHAH
jgi:molybdopterin synthase catalytic subunit